ncbi:hypothetical protein NDU88_012830 [Pleurodeles waltl]|uniref:Uncharacterized protein n=1 Tax=Pleurodeles waltl TaxID=8319 RepID=A0AAV7R6Y9_PLEWA|nr:hypothetical protein NDU88_012830 [Pleurodeles waltl]
MGGSGPRVQGRPQRAPRISHRRIKEEEGGGGAAARIDRRSAFPEFPAPLSPRPSIRGSGRRPRSARARLKSQRAQRATSARPLGAHPSPGPRQQPDPARYRRPTSQGEAPGVRSISAPIRMSLIG